MIALPTDLVLEGLVAILLFATVVYCAMLNRRLKALRSGQDGLRQLIHDLQVATEQAQAGIGGLKEASDVIGKDLDDKLTQGRTLAEELTLMVEAGDRIADRLSNVATRPAMPSLSAPGIVSAGSVISGPFARDTLAGELRDGTAADPEDKPHDVKQAEGRLLKALQKAR